MVGMLVVAAMLLFPPWYWMENIFDGWQSFARSNYDRDVGQPQDYSVAWDRLSLQFGALAAMLVAAFLYFGGRGKDGGA